MKRIHTSNNRDLDKGLENIIEFNKNKFPFKTFYSHPDLHGILVWFK